MNQFTSTTTGANVPSVRERGTEASSLLTTSLLLAATLHLTGFGYLPPKAKFIGDVLLLAACVIARHTAHLRSLRPNAWSTRAPAVLLCYCAAQVAHSAIAWGEPLLVLNQARRWIVLSGYLYLLFSPASVLIASRYVKTYVVSISVVISSILLLARAGIVPPYALELPSYEIQGGVEVLKVFLPGSFILYCLPLLSLASFDLNKHFGAALASHVCLLTSILFVAAALAQFRGWLIGSLFSTALVLLAIVFLSVRQSAAGGRRAYRLVLSTLVVAAAGATVAAKGEAVVEWTQSAVDDAMSGSTNMRYRYELYYIRGLDFLSSAAGTTRWLGHGFVHPEASAAGTLGFSTETNDAGWVEVLLTAGIAGSALVVVIITRCIFGVVKEGLGQISPPLLSVAGLWLTGALLMYTSNPLFWDYGFVPLFLCSIACLQTYHTSRGRARPGGRRHPAVA